MFPVKGTECFSTSSHLDPLLCSCRVAHLSTWAKRHRIRGITCREGGEGGEGGDRGRVIGITSLEEVCLGGNGKLCDVSLKK